MTLWTTAVAVSAVPALSHVLTTLLNTLMASQNRRLKPQPRLTFAGSAKALVATSVRPFALAYGHVKTT